MDEFEWESTAAALRRASKTFLHSAARADAESDRHNGEVMRKDPLLVKLLWAYTNTPAEGRAEFVARALAAQSSNKE